jgi:hypothetical protein
VPELQRLRADHAAAIMAFESANRAYFATSISDRGDEYFERFTEVGPADPSDIGRKTGRLVPAGRRPRVAV